MRLSEKKTVEGPGIRAILRKWPALQHRKMNGAGQRSWPDQMVLIPGGRPLFVECKSPGEEPTVLQAERIERLKGDGYDVIVVDSKEDFIAAVKQRMHGVSGVSRKKARRVEAS